MHTHYLICSDDCCLSLTLFLVYFQVYSNCTCIPGPLPSTGLQPCTVASCTLMPLFMGLFFVSMFIIIMVGAMTGTVTLR